jgi:hypothetical protein
MALYGSTQIVVTLSHVTSHYVAKEDTEHEQTVMEDFNEIVKCYLYKLLKMIFLTRGYV